MRKISLLLSFVVCCAFSDLQAATVSVTQAQSVATNFFKITYPAQVGRGNVAAVLKYTQTEQDGSADFYVFDISGQNSFVIISADDDIIPVIAYSNESYFNPDFQQSALVDWVKKTSVQIHQTKISQLHADTRINHLWTAYNQGVNPGSEKSSGVGPMLSTSWNQLPYYNYQCPINPNDGQRCVTGCVATAMAQIMKYWNYPPQGSGSFSYVDDNAHGYQNNIGTLSANFGTTTYAWTQMPNYITSNNAPVGQLMSQCGISVAMDYSDGGSGAWVLQSEADAAYGYANAPCAEHSYATYFLYNPNTLQGVHQSNYTTTQWINILEGEINAGRVVQYEGDDRVAGGHTWVCDGYDVNNNMHMNWGWGGPYNGFYAVTNLSAGGYTFSNFDAALIGIEPPTYSPPGQGNCVTYHPDFAHDLTATINTIYPNATGTLNDFYAQHWTWNSVPGEVRSLMKLDLSAIPTNAYITSATISFTADDTSALGYVNEPTYGTANACWLQQVTAPWNSSVTWNTQPAVSTVNEITLAQSNNYTENYGNVDISTFVKGWVQNPSTNNGMMIKMQGSAYYNSMIFCSSNVADTTKRPQLEICYYPCNASASFTYQSLGGSVLQFSSTSSSNMALTYNWVFYNQSGAFATSNVADPVVTFAGLPPYSASLMVHDSLNTACFDSVTNSVNFNPNTVCVTLQQGSTTAVGAELQDFTPTQNFDYTSVADFVSSHWTHGGNPTEARGLLKFDLSQIPAGSVIVSAELSLYADTNSIYDVSGQPMYGPANASNLYLVTSAWNASTVDWNTQPTASTTGAVALPQSTSATENYLNLDISSFVTAWAANPNSNYGMLLKMVGTNSLNSMIFCSPGYANPAKWPKLDVCFIPPVTCQAHASFVQQNLGSGQVLFTNTSVDNIPFTSQWTFYNSGGQFASSNLTNPTITFTGQAPYSARLIIIDSICTDTLTQIVNVTNCLVLQTGPTAAVGAELQQYTPTENFDYTVWADFTSSQWTSGGTPAEARGLLQYDLSQIPVGSVILSANLSLYADTNSIYDIVGQPTYGSDNASNLYMVTSAWIPGAVNWNSQPTISTQQPVLLPQSTSTAENYLNLDVSGFVQAWVNNPVNNYGMMLKMLTPNHYNTMIFCSPGYSNSAKWPKLEICYQVSSLCHLVASFTQQDTGNGQIQFTNTSTTNNNVVASWTFYNSTGAFATSNNPNPLITFTGVQPFSATLVISDSATGCLDTVQEPVSISGCSILDSFTYVALGNGAVQFTNASTSTNGAVFLWTFMNANGTIGTSSQLNPLFSFTGPQPYTAVLEVSDSLSRSCIVSFERTIKIPAAINEPGNSAGGLYVFPNPNNGNAFNLYLPADYNTETTQIKMFDMMGRQIEIAQLERHLNLLKVSVGEGCAAGVYTVEVNNNGKQQCCKVVIVK